MSGSAPGGWPRVEWVEVPWVGDPDAPASRRDRARHLGPYRAAVVPAIARVEPRLPGDLVAVCEDAATEMARFDAEADLILGAGELAPMASVLLRGESAASSQIERLTVGARQLALAELGVAAVGNARLVAGNVAAMGAAVRLADRIDADSILAMHAALMGEDDPTAGLFRAEQVWIGGSALAPHDAMFVPPRFGEVPAAIGDLVAFTARTDLPVLAHVALAHAQFETIHPFTDGNGRTGRALAHAMLRHARLTRRITVPISAGLLADPGAYFEALTAYRDGDPAPIVHRFGEAVWACLGNARSLLRELAGVRVSWMRRVHARADAAAWPALDVLLAQPVVHAAHLAERLGVSVTAAQTAIDTLVAAEVLRPSSPTARRNRTWQADDVLDALDAFASRSVRRAVPTAAPTAAPRPLA